MTLFCHCSIYWTFKSGGLKSPDMLPRKPMVESWTEDLNSIEWSWCLLNKKKSARVVTALPQEPSLFICDRQTSFHQCVWQPLTVLCCDVRLLCYSCTDLVYTTRGDAPPPASTTVSSLSAMAATMARLTGWSRTPGVQAGDRMATSGWAETKRTSAVSPPLLATQPSKHSLAHNLWDPVLLRPSTSPGFLLSKTCLKKICYLFIIFSNTLLYKIYIQLFITLVLNFCHEIRIVLNIQGQTKILIQYCTKHFEGFRVWHFTMVNP